MRLPGFTAESSLPERNILYQSDRVDIEVTANRVVPSVELGPIKVWPPCEYKGEVRCLDRESELYGYCIDPVYPLPGTKCPCGYHWTRCGDCGKDPHICPLGSEWLDGIDLNTGECIGGCYCVDGYHRAIDDKGKELDCVKDCEPGEHQNKYRRCVKCSNCERWDASLYGVGGCVDNCPKYLNEYCHMLYGNCQCNPGCTRDKKGVCICCPSNYYFNSVCDACVGICTAGQVYTISNGCIPQCILAGGTGTNPNTDTYWCLHDNGNGKYIQRLGKKMDPKGQPTGVYYYYCTSK
jgi:hypothetical protein